MNKRNLLLIVGLVVLLTFLAGFAVSYGKTVDPNAAFRGREAVVFGDTSYVNHQQKDLQNRGMIVTVSSDLASSLPAAGSVEVQCAVSTKPIVYQATNVSNIPQGIYCPKGVVYKNMTTTNHPDYLYP